MIENHKKKEFFYDKNKKNKQSKKKLCYNVLVLIRRNVHEFN